MDPGAAAIDVHDHGKPLDENKKKVRCNYCGKVVSGFYRLKYHLAGKRGDVTPCEQVFPNVKEQLLIQIQEKKSRTWGKEVGESSTRKRPRRKTQGRHLSEARNLIRETPESRAWGIGTRTMRYDATRIAGSHIANVPAHIKRSIGRFFYENGIDFGAVNGESFQELLKSNFGQGCEIPSIEELKGWILQEELNKMREHVARIRQSWEFTGISLLLDAWTNEDGHNFVNIIADCSQGPTYYCSLDVSEYIGDVDKLQMRLDRIVDKIGRDRVVQIIVPSTEGWMGKIVNKELKKNRGKSVLRNVSATHCIGLMLEEIARLDCFRGVLENAMEVTRFVHGSPLILKLFEDISHADGLIKLSKVESATPFTTLVNIVSQRENLRAVFSSPACKFQYLAWEAEGAMVFYLMEDRSFWEEAEMLAEVVSPLVQLMQLIDEADVPQMGYLYDGIDRAKERIKSLLGSDQSRYQPVWDAIDKVWDGTLHSPLHAAAYYLNPSLSFADERIDVDIEVQTGVSESIALLGSDEPTGALIASQLSDYRRRKGAFQDGCKNDNRDKYLPGIKK